MRKPQFISDRELAKAKIIATYDPVTAEGHKLWGQDSLARVTTPGAAASRVNNVNVEVETQDERLLLQLINRVERVRGRLPGDVQLLRQSLLVKLHCPLGVN